MKTLERGKDKVAAICDALRREALEPALREAEEIREQARAEAEEILREAEAQSAEIVQKGRDALEREKAVFYSNLQQGAQQVVETLRQAIEKELFNNELTQLIDKGSAEPKVVAELVTAVVKAVEKEGLDADLTALVPKTVSTESVNAELLDTIRQKLSGNGVQLGSFGGGAKVRLDGKRMTVDISDDALKELLAGYVRKDFRKMLFGD